jgi:hypothetical protein
MCRHGPTIIMQPHLEPSGSPRLPPEPTLPSPDKEWGAPRVMPDTGVLRHWRRRDGLKLVEIFARRFREAGEEARYTIVSPLFQLVRRRSGGC